MSKDEFILICKYYEKVLNKEKQISEVLGCEFNGDNTFTEMILQFLIDLFKIIGFSEEDSEILEDCISDIYYYGKTCIIDKDKDKKYYLYSYEDIYNDFFNIKN